MVQSQHYPLNSLPTASLIRALVGLMFALGFGAQASSQESLSPASAADPPKASLRWHSDYEQARAEAADRHTLLLVQFHTSRAQEQAAKLWQDSLTISPTRVEKLSQLTLAAVSTDSRVVVNDQPIRLGEHSAFGELQRGPGLAIVDCRDPTSESFRSVISLIPCADTNAESGCRYPAPSEVDVLLNLPEGSLTQRTLVYAVRIHPESPRSADGEWHPALVEEVRAHAAYQATIRVQGHHAWESRFHRINGKLPGDVVAQEVCAESWPSQGLWAAARECVRSWRQSSGHWSAVSASHPYFAYDMQRGANGVWYATGIFGRRR